MSSIRSVFNFKVFWQNFRSAQGLLLVAMIIYQAGILINCFSLSHNPEALRCLIFFSARKKATWCFPLRCRAKRCIGQTGLGACSFF